MGSARRPSFAQQAFVKPYGRFALGLVAACSAGLETAASAESAVGELGAACGGLLGVQCNAKLKCNRKTTPLGAKGTCVVGTPSPGSLGAECGSGLESSAPACADVGLVCPMTTDDTKRCEAEPLFPGELGGICGINDDANKPIVCTTAKAICQKGKVAGIWAIPTADGVGKPCGGPAGGLCSFDQECRNLALEPDSSGVCVQSALGGGGA